MRLPRGAPHVFKSILLGVLLLSPAIALCQAQDLIVDILTTPSRYWNKSVLLNGHVIRVTPDPPGTNRGRFTLRDQSDRDIEVVTDDLPAQGKVYAIKGTVEQRQPTDTVPQIREASRMLSDEFGGPGRVMTEKAPTKRAPEERAPVRREPPVAPAPSPQATAVPVAPAASPPPIPTSSAPAANEGSAGPLALLWQNPTIVYVGGGAVVLILALLLVAVRRKPAPAPVYAPPVTVGMSSQPTLPASAGAGALPAHISDPTMKVERGTELFVPLGASISVSEGPDRGRTFTLGKPVTTLGRAGHRKNDIELSDTTISRDQARIVCDAASRAFTLVNESTTNPTRVNGQVVDSAILQEGDSIEFGATVAKFKRA